MVDGWISLQEINFVLECMENKTPGVILETGSANGRLFNYLFKFFPEWKYVAVDPWEKEEVRLQIDWNKDYFYPNNLGEIITKEMFIKNCPFAEIHQEYYENWQTCEKYDIISMGLVSKKVDWNKAYKKAVSMLAEDGTLVARNLNHKKYGNEILSALDECNLVKIKQVNGSASYKRKTNE